MLYGLFWQEVFPWPTTEDETPESTSPVSGDYIAEVVDLEPGQVLPYCFECLEGGRLEFAVSSLLPIDIALCNGEQLEAWADLDFDDAAISTFEIRREIQSALLSIRIPVKGEYAVVLFNNHDYPTPVIISANLGDPIAAAV